MLLCLLVSFTLYGRVFFTGSNPAMSSFAFPQDIMLIPGEQAFTYFVWETFPWWGDIDEPENRPYNKYILNGEKTSESHYYAAINTFSIRPGFTRQPKENLKLKFDLLMQADRLKADAKGVQEDGIRYAYLEKHAIREAYLNTMIATFYKGLPVGFRIGLGAVNTTKPALDHDLSSGVQSKRLRWGWEKDTERWQDEFAVGSLFKMDLQAAATFENHKAGTRFRLHTGSLDNYGWVDSLQDYSVTQKKIHNYTFRLYGIYNWFKREKFRFNTTVLTRFTTVDSITQNPAPGHQDEINAIEKSRQFVFQINPNINVYPWKYPMTYIDAAILCNYQHMRYDFRTPGGRYIGTPVPWDLEDYTYADFSFARENFFEIALDIFASIPVFGIRDRMAAIGISTLIWRRYKWMNKYYYDWDGDEIHGKRKNFDRETWLNAVISLMYRHRKFMYRLDVGQPLIYSLTPRTRLYDNSRDDPDRRDRVLSHEKMWLAQSGFRIGFYISTALENLIRYKPIATPYETSR